jgi:hypothetical protein
MATDMRGRDTESQQRDTNTPQDQLAEHASLAAANTLAMTQSAPVAPRPFARLLRALRLSTKHNVRPSGIQHAPRIGGFAPDWEYITNIAAKQDSHMWANTMTGTNNHAVPWASPYDGRAA